MVNIAVGTRDAAVEPGGLLVCYHKLVLFIELYIS